MVSCACFDGYGPHPPSAVQQLFLPVNIVIIVAGIEDPLATERTTDSMGDSGEGLVDASSRLQERMEEIQDSRRMTKQGELRLDPERIRALESLRLAKIDLERQLSMTVHAVRRLHLVNALAEIDRRLSNLQTTA